MKLFNHNFDMEVPLMDSVIKDKIIQRIKDFALNFDETTISEWYSLGRGIPGLCILYAELHQIFPTEGWDKIAYEKIVFLNENTDYNTLDLSLYHGLSGIGAGILALSSEGNYKSYMNSINLIILDKLDGQLDLVEKKISQANYAVKDYDLISGLVGILRYLLEIKDDNLKSYKNRMIDILIDITNDQICQESNQIKSINMGTAHGLSGVLAVLSTGYLKGFKSENLRSTITILKDFFETNSFYTLGIQVYPEKLPFTLSEKHQSLINDSWCYGLTGINSSLILAAKALDDSEFLNRSINNYSKFVEEYLKEDKIYSTIICHGISSILYEYSITKQNKKYSKTYSKKIMLFLDELLRMADLNNFNPFPDRSADLTYLKYNPGFIDGSVGVYLILLSLITNKQIASDWIFLRS